MKKITTYWLLAAAMTLAGCASDNDIATEYAGDENDAVTINATRVATSTSLYSTALAEGETFCLVNETRQSLGRTNKYKAVYEVTSSGIVPQESAEYVVWQTGKDKSGNEITQNTFRAVIPDDAPLSNFQLPTDQSTADKLKAADWQLASDSPEVTAMQTKPTLSLNFEHQLAKIVITISENVKSDLASLSNLQILGSVTPLYSADDRTIQAIVEPATSTPNAPLLTFADAAGETYIISLPTSITSLDKGKQYNFTLTGGHDLLTISSVSVTDWTSEPINMESSDAKTDQYDYVTFTAEGEQGFKFVVTPYSEGSLCTIPGFEYSVDNGEWKSIPATGMTEEDEWITFGGGQSSLRLRGKNLNGTSVDNGYSRVSFKDNNVKVACSGDIRTLIDYENYANVDTKNARFIFLFSKCVPLTSAPKLPATDLADYCYAYMFNDCQSLTDAPALPATILADWCYYDMFQRCISLHKAPTLPATDLATGCYAGMFTLCTSLTEAPELPATKLANDCYIGMFTLCTLLTEAPELPATTLANNCYSQMFAVCYSLRKAPDLPAKTLTSGCYNEMFINCITLSEIKMLASNIDNNISPLTGWLKGAGKSATSRKLIVDSQDTYNGLAGYNLLPDQWKSTETGATVVDKNGNAITDD